MLNLCWLVYGVPHHRFTSMTWDHIFNFVNDNLGKPVVCLGDWNEIMCDMDTTSGNVNKYRMCAFNNFVKQCGLFELGYSGPAYSWTNKRFSSIPIFERLDRCLANAEWCSLLPIQMSSIFLSCSVIMPLFLFPLLHNITNQDLPLNSKIGGLSKRTSKL